MPMSAMKRLFTLMAEKKASDIFLSVGSPINIKINGVAMPVNQAVMTGDSIKQLLYEILTERQIKEYEEEMELNTALPIEGVGSFRISAIRDKQTMAAALAYSQSGHLCLATLHANNSYHAMNRIINFYPLENRPSLLLDLAAALQSIVSQRLVRTKSGARVAAVEVLLNTRHIAELIEKGEINEIKEALEKSMSPGSQTFEQALFKLFMDGKITQEEAMANADSATNMLWLINQATAGEISGQALPPKAAAETSGEKSGAEEKKGILAGGGG